MQLQVFPFGKYKGMEIEEIPTTYLAFAIESFNLPEDFTNRMRSVIMQRLGIDNMLISKMDADIPKYKKNKAKPEKWLFYSLMDYKLDSHE